MDDDRLPKQLLYEELSTASRTAGGKLKRYKDCTKKALKLFNISPENLETQATVRKERRVQTKPDLAYFEEARARRLQEARQRRHREATSGHSSAATATTARSEDGTVHHASVCSATRGPIGGGTQNGPSSSDTTDYHEQVSTYATFKPRTLV